MPFKIRRRYLWCVAIAIWVSGLLIALAQQSSPTLDFSTPDFTLKLLKSSQTVAALQPNGNSGFDFTPADRLQNRTADRFNALGDLTFRVREGSSGAWQDYATSAARQPVTAIPLKLQSLQRRIWRRHCRPTARSR